MKIIDSTVKAVQDEIFLSKLEQARQLSVGQKLLAGPELFDMGLMMMRSGIRMRYPEYNEKQVNNEIFRRLEIVRRIDDGDRYRPLDAINKQLRCRSPNTRGTRITLGKIAFRFLPANGVS